MHAHSSQLKRFVCAHVCMFELASCEIQHWEKKRRCLCVSLVQHTCAFIITKDVCHVCVFFCVHVNLICLSGLSSWKRCHESVLVHLCFACEQDRVCAYQWIPGCGGKKT
jgi:hypothetical protein